jgi:hypothetical protein
MVNNPSMGYIRGSCSTLDKRHGNLHGHAVVETRKCFAASTSSNTSAVHRSLS